MTTPVVDFQGIIDRGVAVCVEAVSGSEGRGYWFHSQETTPFFIGRIGNLTIGKDGDEVDVYAFDLVIRHVTGNRTEGIQGEAEAKLYAQMPIVLAALVSRDLLQSAAYPTALDWLERIGEDTDITCLGLSVFDAKGIGGVSDQIGTEYTLPYIARTQNEQDYE